MNIALYLIFGLIFGLGLSYSGMTDPNKVLGFLDLLGDWDPSLAFVMASGVVTTMLAYRLILKRKPILAKEFCLPGKRHIDRDLIIGALLFGIGLYGYCPGPAVASLSYLQTDSYLFVAAMMAGVYLRSRQNKVANATADK